MNKKEKAFRTIFTSLFIIFIGLSLTNKAGFKEYELHKNVELTNEQIKKFENDVKNNKNVDINDYIRNTKEDYSNDFSKASLNFSNVTSKYIKKGINKIFDTISKLIS